MRIRLLVFDATNLDAKKRVLGKPLCDSSIPDCPICQKQPHLQEANVDGVPTSYKFFCGVHCSAGDWFHSKEEALADWVDRVQTKRGEPVAVTTAEQVLSAIMTVKEAVAILRGSNEQLVTQMSKLAEEAAALGNGCGGAGIYSTLGYCQKEYAACQLAIIALNEYQARHDVVDMATALPLDAWSEDDGDVLWWFFPIQEAPYCGSPLDTAFPSHVTHWTRFICPADVQKEGSPTNKKENMT